ncbi:uncharacterized protein LOC108908036 isoform X2 [Anoplophora glabripennis]|uniref:uncharacterized protein LOC108908036 isoform X2 n=1 Tax=Anoplophora glabripennis TaxID=217634 RepID=UPI00087523F6|nr:uncharacterized protein LOC108908036 isoform X2 [Anoplophora glabripennis]
MALRNIKITRDLAQTCNKTRAFTKSDLCTLPPQKPVELLENAPKLHSVAYSLNSQCNYLKNVLPEENATEKNGNIGYFLTKLIKESQLPKTCTHKGTTININTGETVTNTSNTSSLFTSTRSYSTGKSYKGGCKPSERKCNKNLPCPEFKLPDCPPMKAPKSDCSRGYMDPHCTKKMAPYPSYSELCAYRLENDPSECKQCPWQRCGGAHDIKPQKKGYHTSTRSMNMAMIPNKSADALFFLHKQCDASKEPCKEPPPKCKKREVKHEKCPEKKEKPKKKCTIDASPPEAWTISGSIRNLDFQKDQPFLKIAKEHDKGHPPPCKDKRKPKSERCPPEVDKKKVYRQQSDLYESTYRKYPHPYNDES